MEIYRDKTSSVLWTILWLNSCLFVAVTASFDLTVLHTNDVHSRVEPFTKYGTDCDADDAQEGKCFGGIARRVTAVNDIRKAHENVILIDAGDQFLGTLWFTYYKGSAASYFMKHIGYDVMVSYRFVFMSRHNM